MAKVKAAVETAIIEVPVAEPESWTYIARETGEIKASLDGAGTIAFRRFHAGLLRDNAKMPNGRPVASKADALKWLFANLAGE